MSWNKQERLQIEATISELINCAQGKDSSVFAAAIMTLTARVVTYSTETDAYIIEQFRQSLAAARQLQRLHDASSAESGAA